MIWTAALLLVLACLGLLRVLRVPQRAAAVLVRTKQAVADIRSKTLSDLDKERAMRAHSVALFGQFLLITALTLLALAIPAGVVWLLGKAELIDFEAVLDATLSWSVLLVATIAGFVVLFAGKR